MTIAAVAILALLAIGTIAVRRMDAAEQRIVDATDEPVEGT